MRTSIQFDTPSTHDVEQKKSLRLNPEKIETAAETVFQQERAESESPSLEARVRNLTKLRTDQSPDEVKAETEECEAKLLALLEQVREVQFNTEFLIGDELKRGNE